MIAPNGVAAALSRNAPIELGRPQTESANSRRGLTLNQGLVDWRATVNGTRTCSADGCDSSLEGRDYRTLYCSRLCRNRGWWSKNRAKVKFVRPDTAERKTEALARLFEHRAIVNDGCWNWQGRKMRNGYGVICIWSGQRPTHRVAWEALREPIPDGMQIDHLCRNRLCFNPDHLEPVTQRENLLRGETVSGINARKTHCLRGHELIPENLYRGGNKRICRACTRLRQNERRARGMSS